MKLNDVRSFYYQRVLGLSSLWMRAHQPAPLDLVKGVHILYVGIQTEANQDLLKKMISALKYPAATFQSVEKMSGDEFANILDGLKVTHLLVFGSIQGFNEVKPGQVLELMNKKVFFTHSPEVLQGDTDPIKLQKREAWSHMQLLIRELA